LKAPLHRPKASAATAGEDPFMLRIVRIFAFGLWLGVMTGFAFLFAPVAFARIGPTPQFAGMIAAVIEQITNFGYGCAAVAIAASIPDVRRDSRLWAVIALALLMALLGWFEVGAIIPAMQHIPLMTPAYEALHRRSSSVYGAVMVLGAIALVLSATSPRSRFSS
jgi:hypothetical protein